MAGSASNWFKPSGGPLKGQAFYVPLARRAALGGDRASIMDALTRGNVDQLGADGAPLRAHLLTGPSGGAGAIPRPPAARVRSLRSSIRRELHDTYGDDADSVEREALDAVRRWVDDADLCVRVPPGVLGAILQDGFKNQYATGTSTGFLDANDRQNAEHRMFGIALGSAPESYPIYGYLEPRSGATAAGAHKYGSVRVVLREETKARTSITVGDSLDGGADDGAVIPSPARSPSLEAFGRNWVDVAEGRSDSLSDLSNSPVGYVEAQVHGRVRARDIARVDFTQEPPAAIRADLDRLGIPWQVSEATTPKPKRVMLTRPAFLRGG